MAGEISRLRPEMLSRVSARGMGSRCSAEPLDLLVYYNYSTPAKEHMMLENPVAKRAAIGAAIGAVVAIPLPFIGPILGAIVGGGVGYFTAQPRKLG